MEEPRAAERGGIEGGRTCEKGGSLRGGKVGLGRPTDEDGVMGVDGGKTDERGEDGKDIGLLSCAKIEDRCSEVFSL